jgi:hypothetical protein
LSWSPRRGNRAATRAGTHIRARFSSPSKEGALSVFDGNCNAREVTAEEAFVEPVGEPMEVKNYGTVPAVAYFAIVLAPGEPGRLDEPNPGCEIP